MRVSLAHTHTDTYTDSDTDTDTDEHVTRFDEFDDHDGPDDLEAPDELADPEEGTRQRQLLCSGPPSSATALTQALVRSGVNATIIGPYRYLPGDADPPRAEVDIVATGADSAITEALQGFMARTKGRAEVRVGAATVPTDRCSGNIRVIGEV